MADNLHLPKAILPSFGYLRSLSVITSDYIGEAVKDWVANPPVEEFTNILDADLESLQDKARAIRRDVSVIDYANIPQTLAGIDYGNGSDTHAQTYFEGDRIVRVWTRSISTDATDLGLPEFYFNSRSQRYHYRDTGAFVSQSAVDNLTARAIAQKRNEIRDLGEKLIGKLVTLDEWEKQTAGHLKQLHTWTYLLGKGGQANMSLSDYGRLGLRLSYEYGYLRGFSEKIRDEGMSEAQFLARLELYINKANGTKQIAIQSSHREAGYLWERRYLRAVENCKSCVSYAVMGWQPLGSLPAPTEKCECQSNCKCYFKFSRDLSKPEDMLKRRMGWL
jgi:hypothetical protein